MPVLDAQSTIRVTGFLSAISVDSLDDAVSKLASLQRQADVKAVMP